jgi:hypothetical protein
MMRFAKLYMDAKFLKQIFRQEAFVPSHDEQPVEDFSPSIREIALQM